LGWSDPTAFLAIHLGLYREPSQRFEPTSFAVQLGQSPADLMNGRV
jgi:hypothetical protein